MFLIDEFYHSDSVHKDGVKSVKIWYTASGKNPILVLWLWYELPVSSSDIDYGCGRAKECAFAVHAVLNTYNQELPWQEMLLEAQAHKEEILIEQKKRMESYRRQNEEYGHDDKAIRKCYGTWRLGLSEKSNFWEEILEYGPDGIRRIKDKR